MKTAIYRKWLRLVVSEFGYSRQLKRPNGKYFLARRLWRYEKAFPNADNWVVELVRRFKAEMCRSK